MEISLDQTQISGKLFGGISSQEGHQKLRNGSLESQLVVMIETLLMISHDISQPNILFDLFSHLK